MDKETIKQQYSMRDVLSRYGMVPNRAGFINCPFHPKDRTASMKIYKDRNPKKFCCLKVVNDLDGYLEEQKASLFQISDPVFD